MGGAGASAPFGRSATPERDAPERAGDPSAVAQRPIHAAGPASHTAPDGAGGAGGPGPLARFAEPGPAAPENLDGTEVPSRQGRSAGPGRAAPDQANAAPNPAPPPRSAQLDRAAPGRVEGLGALARLTHAAGLDRAALERLAGADAFRGIGLDRRAALWEAAAAEPPTALPAAAVHEPAALLPKATAGEQTVLDYAGTSLTLRHHPLALLRPMLEAEGLADTRALASARRGAKLRLPGLVLVRQRPGSAKGVVFFTVEDEWGTANLVVYAGLVRRFRAAVVSARLVVAEGRVERTEAEVPIVHLIVQRLLDRSDLLFGLAALDRPDAAGPWRKTLARADEVEKPDLRGGPRARLPRSRDFH